MVTVSTVSSPVYSDYYTNKLYKFRRGNQKLGDPVSVVATPGKISVKVPGVCLLPTTLPAIEIAC